MAAKRDSRRENWEDLRERLRIDDCDIWLFRELYAVLASFADKPQNSISRIGGGRISIPDDQGNDLGHFRQVILEKYPDVAGLRSCASPRKSMQSSAAAVWGRGIRRVFLDERGIPTA